MPDVTESSPGSSTRRVIGRAALAVGGGAVVVARQLQRRADSGAGEAAEPRSRWRAVTVNRGPDDVLPGGRLPAPLAELGDAVEVEVRAAPGEWGSELRARLRQPDSRNTKQGEEVGPEQVRSALREAKQLIEVGEVLRVDPTPHGRRTATPLGGLVEKATDKAPGEGVL